jgi:alpha-tubulin suppressor-like RCC1 family protein
VVAVEVGYFCTLAQHANGTVSGWGEATGGVLGVNLTGPQPTPVTIAGVQNPMQLSVGQGCAFAVLPSGNVIVWGNGQNLGMGLNPYSGPQPPQVHPYLFNIVAMSADRHVLALDSNGRVFTWGTNNHGQLGLMHHMTTSYPQQVSLLPPNIVSVCASGDHSLALDAQGFLYAWGSNVYGQLGLGDTVDRTTPQWVTSAPTGITQLSAGESHTIIRTIDGRVWVCGGNYKDQLGIPGGDILVLTPLPGLPHATHVSGVNAAHTIARTWDGDLFAWGSNLGGQLGQGSAGGTLPMPTLVTGFPVLPPLRLSGPGSVSVGQTLSLGIATVPAFPGIPYFVEISLAGSSPGLVVPGTVDSLPLNPPFLYSTLGYLLPGVFQGLVGALNATGNGTATVNVPAAPVLVGLELSSAGLGIDLVTNRMLISNGITTQLIP